MASLLDTFAPDLGAQVADAKQTAQQAATAVAGWGVVMVIELAVVIVLLARRGKSG